MQRAAAHTGDHCHLPYGNLTNARASKSRTGLACATASASACSAAGATGFPALATRSSAGTLGISAGALNMHDGYMPCGALGEDREAHAQTDRGPRERVRM